MTSPSSPSATSQEPESPNTTYTPDQATTTTTAKSKVPRPPNAFIIYRKAWHSETVQLNPTVHNNQICKSRRCVSYLRIFTDDCLAVIIGNQWKNESQEVIDEYKRKAEEAKQQHAIANPGYQYQPRKPSEKKKRMTKNKIAKLAAKTQANGTSTVAQQALPTDFDAVAMLDKALSEVAVKQAIDVNSYRPQWVQKAPVVQREGAYLNFFAAHDTNNGLGPQLDGWNNAMPAPANAIIPTQTISTLPIVDGRYSRPPVRNVLIEEPVLTDAQWAEIMSTTPGNTTTTNGPAYNNPAPPPRPDYSMAEVERQMRLDADFENFIDFNAGDIRNMPRIVDERDNGDPQNIMGVLEAAEQGHLPPYAIDFSARPTEFELDFEHYVN